MPPPSVDRVSVDIAGTEISFETGKLAKQAGGSVVVRAGDTMVLCTATAGNPRDVDFLPLTVDVEERMYAAGKIPGSFFKREGRPSEKGILTARMIDRPIRPLFPKGWHRETQIVATPMCVDHVVPYDILAMNGASAALALSDIPFPTQMAAVRIGKLEGKFVVNPAEPDIAESELDLIVAGTDDAILMVEAGANEITEPELLDALEIAHDEIKKLCAAQRELAEKAGKPKIVLEEPQVDQGCSTRSRRRMATSSTARRRSRTSSSARTRPRRSRRRCSRKYALLDDEAADASTRSAAPRCSARSTSSRRTSSAGASPSTSGGPTAARADEIREIWAEVGVAPRTHGSAIFTRGQTQAYTVATLGTSREEQRLDTLGLETAKRYFHHYNFPPYSVGEAGFMRGPKRRDIGHGALAERALLPMIPSQEDFPYTIRVVSDILESNGSSSMASVCGSTLSLMDAGVKIHKPVAGIAMGLIKEGDDYVVLSDIAGVEDHLGDMDFKVAGTPDGITALQMDIKITGVTFEILKTALEQAHAGRQFILGKMQDTISETRAELSPHAPRITSIQIDPEKIGTVIGKGGETIRALSEEYEAQIDVDDDGMVLVYAVNGEKGDACVEAIRQMTKDVELGEVFTGKVVKTTTFGAFVELTKGTDGLLHISNLVPGGRAETVEDVVNRGDEVKVRVVELNKERGRIGLRLADDPEIADKTAEELSKIGTGNGGRPSGGRDGRP